MTEFRHFSPLGKDESVKKLTPNFPLGAGQIDFGSIKKNIPHFEELAVSVGLGAMKGAILKNTFQFFKSATSNQERNFNFPADATGYKDSPDTLPRIGTSVLGTPVFSNLQIKGASYHDNIGKTIGTFQDVSIDAVIMKINRTTNIVIEEIQGRENNVIEYIANNSWTVNCIGKIISPRRNTYPYTDSKNLITALNCNKSIEVTSWFLNMAGIYNVVIKDRDLPQEEGGMEWQRFEFNAISDAPVVLRLKK